MHFVFNCICSSIFCLTTSSLSARSSAASYSSRAVVFRCTSLTILQTLVHAYLIVFYFAYINNLNVSLKIVQLNNDDLNCQEIFFFFGPIESEFQFNTNANISEENFIVGVT